MCNNTQKKKAAGAGRDFTLFFGVMLHFNFKCVFFNPLRYIIYIKQFCPLGCSFGEFWLLSNKYSHAVLSHDNSVVM